MRKPMLRSLPLLLASLLLAPAMAGAQVATVQGAGQAPGATAAAAPVSVDSGAPTAKPAKPATRSRSVLGQAFADLTQAAESRRAAATTRAPVAPPASSAAAAKPAPAQTVQDLAVQDMAVQDLAIQDPAP